LLGLETLLEYVEHFSAQVENEKGHNCRVEHGFLGCSGGGSGGQYWSLIAAKMKIIKMK